MSSSQKIILVGVILIGGMLIYYRNHPAQQLPLANGSANQQGTTGPTWPAKIDEQASVNVIVTPLDMSAHSNEWRFDISMNTHVVPLDQDMVNIAVLVDENGKIYKPLRWEGAPAGGHHRDGVLVFNPITPIPKSITMKISDIGGVERSFIWQM